VAGILIHSKDFLGYLSEEYRCLDSSLLIQVPGLKDGIRVNSIVDGFSCDIQRPSENFKDFYSGKEKDYVVRYQIWTSLNGRILSLFGPMAGASNDLSLIDASGLISHLNNLEYVLSDGIYKARDHMLVTKHSQNLPEGPTKELNREFCARRAVVEQTIHKIKVFKYASERSRKYKPSYHGCFLKIIAILVNFNQIYADNF